MTAAVTQQPVSVPAPSADEDAVAYEGDRCFLRHPVCPNCGSGSIKKNGSYQRNPKGRRPASLDASGPLRIQQYECHSCSNPFSPSLPFIKDGYRYTDELRRDVQAAEIIFPTTIDKLGTFCTVRHQTTPSRAALDNWTHSSSEADSPTFAGEVVVNDLPTYSSVYLLDEDWITIAGERWYRVTVFDVLMKAPVLEGLVEAQDNEAIAEVVEPVLRDKPMRAIVTDGRSGSATLVADELGALHYRCGAHKAGNVRDALGNSLSDDDLSKVEKIAARRISSEVCEVLTNHSNPDGLGHYARIRERFKEVLDDIEHTPEPLQKQLQAIDAMYEKFTAHHRLPWLPGTINELENYFRHTQPERVEHRFQSSQRLLSFLDKQMTLWTVKHGLVSRETSLARTRELFPYLDKPSVEALFSEQKHQFLWSCDIWAG